MATTTDFPINWENPEDARLFWTQDREHYPEPVRPLPFSLHAETFEPGFQAAARAYDLPFVGPRALRINTYYYSTNVPASGRPDELAAQGQRAQEKLGAAMARLGDLWAREWLPEIKEHRAFGEAFDLHGAKIPELLAHLDETLARTIRLWDLHFQIVFPAYLAVGLFDEYYRDLFPEAEAFAAHRLLAGFDNKSLERDRALWQLSRQVLASPAVKAMLEGHEVATALAELEKSAEGREFLLGLRTFLAEFGWAGEPPWIMEPTPIVQILLEYLKQPDRDLAAEMAAVVAEREQALAEARARLVGYPRPVVERFEFLLKAAQQGNILTEDHAHWIDQRRPHEVLPEFGRRFAAAGVIAEPDDLSFLTLDEVRATAVAPSPVDRRALVAERQTEMERFAAVTPPPVLGTPPAGPPQDNPFMRVMAQFMGTPPPPAETPNEVRGHAGSPGRTRGPARIIHSLADVGRLRAGDVLVTATTWPAWTPLFATAAAVVTDIGGILSHCAVVAREYRIPAVVGTGRATTTFHDGQLLEVDGDAGVVRVVD